MDSPSTSHSVCEKAGKNRGWSGSQVRLTRPELTIYRTAHLRPLAPNPSTSPRAAPRDLGRSRAISGDLGASLAPQHPKASSADSRAALGAPAPSGCGAAQHRTARGALRPTGIGIPGLRPAVATRGSIHPWGPAVCSWTPSGSDLKRVVPCRFVFTRLATACGTVAVRTFFPDQPPHSPSLAQAGRRPSETSLCPVLSERALL